MRTSTSEPWSLYMIECKGGGIYVGIAKDVQERYEKHVNGEGALYTRMNKPLRLLASIEYPSRGAAMEAEHEAKKLNRFEKMRWASGHGLDDAINLQLKEYLK